MGVTFESTASGPTVRFEGRVLFLTESPELIRRQLAGEDLDWDPSIKLRDDISTDEITPGWVCYHYDEKLGEYPYVGLECRGERPVGQNDVKKGGFVACVSGKRRGKGSSREASPFAELNAGIRIVIAENIERIYRENCQNLGLFTSTDFGLIDRIRNGAAIPLAEFTEGADPITKEIVERGGLFAYNEARAKGEVSPPSPATAAERPLTLAEKILASRWIADLAKGELGVAAVKPGDTGFVRTDIRFSHEYVTPMAAGLYGQYTPDAEIREKESVLLFRDHLGMLDLVISEERKAAGLLDLAGGLAKRQKEFSEEQGLRLHGDLKDRKGSEGICHSIVYGHYAIPGQVIVGSDSHTPHSGALGTVAFGVGSTAIASAWVTQDVRISVPETIKVEVAGRKPDNVTAKDIVLEVLRRPFVKDGGAVAKILEWTGPAVAALSVDERATLTNMSAEIGAFTGICNADENTVEFLVERRGMDRAEAERFCESARSDPGAEYAHVIEVDASKLRPIVAIPGDPGRGVFVDELEGPVDIDLVYIGSCTGAKRDDMDMYARVFGPAAAAGQRIPETVTCYIQMGSLDVEEYCRRQGYLEAFRAVGAQLLAPGCGACINAGPGVSTSPEQVTISSINRNFPGRSGPGKVYLASPYTVAASALAGRIVVWEPR
ncbi:MAG: 3-isopropylmalate dehydratase [Gemmatimonadetes bacterium]|nr:3-isopropylmalate dehydratase [Gemmatimonadota bacterium]NIO31010.1 3-isopropylmalate dehydratase [Gemmatimonadota bacterium]